MRGLLVALLLQACVSSNIQIGEEAVDSGPVDVQVVDAGSDVSPPEDASIDGFMAAPDVICAAPAVVLYPCFEGSCEPVVSSMDDLCGLRCEPAPPTCFTSCEHDGDCGLTYECCEGPACDLRARNQIGQEIYNGCSPNVVPVESIALCGNDNKCEVIFVPECVVGDECLVVGSPGPECGGEIALTEELLEAYIEYVCPSDDPMPEPCCRQLGDNQRPAFCADSVCQPGDRTP